MIYEADLITKNITENIVYIPKKSVESIKTLNDNKLFFAMHFPIQTQ
jgi:hypothetical protein